MPTKSHHALIQGLLLFLLNALALLVVFHFTRLNELVSRYYFDPGLPGFPLRQDPLLKYWLHDALRKVLWLSPLAVSALYVHSMYTSRWSLSSKRWVWLLLAQGAAVLAVSLLKVHTSPICPWDQKQFGGATDEPLFAFVSSLHAGHCFPAGHPSGGWALLAYAYFWRDTKPSLARWAFYVALALGALMAWVQIARGAHLLSHVLWSLWVCWLVVWLAYQCCWPKPVLSVSAGHQR